MALYPKPYTLNPIRGQVMLLTVVLLAGSVLGTTSIAGVLTLFQLRQASFATDSMRAIFAADTGIEWELYRQYQDPSAVPPTMSNGAVFKTKTGVDFIQSTGYNDEKEKVARAFEVNF